METSLERAVELALQAPSIHNTQPWLFRLGGDAVELHADTHRHLTGTDPGRRDLLISCGAVLHHLAVAAAGLGIAVEIHRFPDPEDRDHLATVRRTGGPVDRTAAGLFGQLGRRHTDRRPFTAEPIPVPALQRLVACAVDFDVVVSPVTDPAILRRLHEVLLDAAREQPHEPGYLVDLLRWTHRYVDAHDGVPASAVPRRGTAPFDQRVQRFPAGTLPVRPGPGLDSGTLLVLATARDDRAAQLAAGEATSAVLLSATRSGLATTPLSQATEVPQARERLRTRALHLREHPQLMIRIGRPQPGSPPLRATPRRSLASVLLRG